MEGDCCFGEDSGRQVDFVDYFGQLSRFINGLHQLEGLLLPS
jgi:hypothetical protein